MKGLSSFQDLQNNLASRILILALEMQRTLPEKIDHFF